MPSKRCEGCGLVNPASAMRCDCGYDFASRSVRTPFVSQRPPSANASSARGFAILGRIILIIIGLAIMAFARMHRF